MSGTSPYDTPALEAFAVKHRGRVKDVRQISVAMTGILEFLRDEGVAPPSFLAALGVEITILLASNPRIGSAHDRSQLIDEFFAAFRADVEQMCLEIDRDPEFGPRPLG